MRPERDKFDLGWASLLCIFLGLVSIVTSLIALKHGATVEFGKSSKVQVNPGSLLIFSIVLVGLGIAGIYKIYRGNDKWPF
jgi:hypothetical protein